MGLYRKVETYKESIFNTYEISLEVIMGQKVYIKGFKEEKFQKHSYKAVCISVDKILEVKATEFKKGEAVVIYGVNTDDEECTIYLPEFDFTEIRQVIDAEKEIKSKLDEERKQRERLLEDKRRQEELEKLEKERVREEYIKVHYSDIKDNEPVYVFEENESYATFLHIDKDKNMLIKSVDKNRMETVSSRISYNDIHYYLSFRKM